jgi:transcriptional regulator with XRE-family HTH domain
MGFAERLRGLREAAGLTQAALADRSGLSIRTIQSWEQTKRAPVSEAFFALCDALGVPADAFRPAPAAKSTKRARK